MNRLAKKKKHTHYVQTFESTALHIHVANTATYVLCYAVLCIDVNVVAADCTNGSDSTTGTYVLNNYYIYICTPFVWRMSP